MACRDTSFHSNIDNENMEAVCRSAGKSIWVTFRHNPEGRVENAETASFHFASKEEFTEFAKEVLAVCEKTGIMV